jgi:hypothetical protein
MLSIPDEHIAYIHKIDDLSEAERAAILNCIAGNTSAENINDLITCTAECSEVERDKVTASFAIAGSIISTSVKFTKSYVDVTKDFVSSLVALEKPVKQKSIDFIQAIINSSRVSFLFKRETLEDVSDIILTSRILTDLRPVFSDDGSTIQGTFLINTLLLESSNSGTSTRHRFSLTAADIESLINTLNRAKTKSIALQSYTEGRK